MSKGFTIFEMVLVLALFGVVLATVSLPLIAFRGQRAMDDAAILLTDVLRRAETQALAGHFGDGWGVHLSDSDGCALPASKYHLFRGSAFTSATDTIDTFDLPDTITVTALGIGGGCDVKFSRFHGAATTTGTITLSGPNGLTRTISINGYGRVVAE